MLRQISLGSLIALLIVLGVTVPTSVLGQSDDLILFGPQKYVVTSSPSVFTNFFTVSEHCLVEVNVVNGIPPWVPFVIDHQRVTSGTIRINGLPVITAAKLNDSQPFAAAAIELWPGEKNVRVKLEANPGSFIVLTIAKVPPPQFHHGMLVLPYASIKNSETVKLLLRNNNPRFPKHLRVVFFDLPGHISGMSDSIHLPANGSVALNAADIGGPHATWEEGSMEIIWLGRGKLPLSGYAQLTTAAGESVTIPLERFPFPIPRHEIEE